MQEKVASGNIELQVFDAFRHFRFLTSPLDYAEVLKLGQQEVAKHMEANAKELEAANALQTGNRKRSANNAEIVNDENGKHDQGPSNGASSSAAVPLAAGANDPANASDSSGRLAVPEGGEGVVNQGEPLSTAEGSPTKQNRSEEVEQKTPGARVPKLGDTPAKGDARGSKRLRKVGTNDEPKV